LLAIGEVQLFNRHQKKQSSITDADIRFFGVAVILWLSNQGLLSPEAVNSLACDEWWLLAQVARLAKH
jgi:hypothetical protein